jgi:hypothetical protein
MNRCTYLSRNIVFVRQTFPRTTPALLIHVCNSIRSLKSMHAVLDKNIHNSLIALRSMHARLSLSPASASSNYIIELHHHQVNQENSNALII